MGGPENGRVYECVGIDLNTQYDFCNASGSSRVANIDDLLPALRRVIAWMKRNHAPIVSAIDSHRTSEITSHGYPCHCVDGTIGQRKIEFTLFPQHARVEVDNTLSLQLNLFETFQQVIFRKRTSDLLANPKADRFLTQLSAREFLVFGTAVETSVKAIVLSLRARNKTVTVIADACGFWSIGAAELAFRQMCAKGAQMTTVDRLLARKLARRHRYPLALKSGKASNGVRGRNGAAPTHQRITERGSNGRLPRSVSPTRIRVRNARAGRDASEG